MPILKKLILIALILLAFSAIYKFYGLERVSKNIFYKAQATLVLALDKDINIRLAVPFHKQEHALSCEIATLKMALNYYGVGVAEEDLLKDLPFDTKQPRSKENIWGDPDKGFVGNIDGKIPNTGYGVYEKPIVELAEKYRRARILQDPSLSDVLEEVAKKRPVIVWGAIGSSKDISWRTKDGRFIKAVSGEHTRLIIGFSGTVSNPKNIILLDPIYGKRVVSKNSFLSDWSLLDNKAVVVY